MTLQDEKARFVLLHPLGADRHFWAPVGAELGADSTVAIDLPGHGSAKPLEKGAGAPAFAAAVAEQLAGPAHVVGMSLGGVVAQQLALDRPDLVASVVLVDTVPVYPAPMRQMWRDRADAARRGELPALVAPMVEMWFSASLIGDGDHRVQRARDTFTGTDPEGYARSCDLLAEVDLTGRLGELTVPVTVVCGRDDAAPFRAAAQWMAEVTGAGPVHWLPGRHACAIESPLEFAEVLTGVTAH